MCNVSTSRRGTRGCYIATSVRWRCPLNLNVFPQRRLPLLVARPYGRCARTRFPPMVLPHAGFCLSSLLGSVPTLCHSQLRKPSHGPLSMTINPKSINNPFPPWLDLWVVNQTRCGRTKRHVLRAADLPDLYVTSYRFLFFSCRLTSVSRKVQIDTRLLFLLTLLSHSHGLVSLLPNYSRPGSSTLSSRFQFDLANHRKFTCVPV